MLSICNWIQFPSVVLLFFFLRTHQVLDGLCRAEHKKERNDPSLAVWFVIALKSEPVSFMAIFGYLTGNVRGILFCMHTACHISKTWVFVVCNDELLKGVWFMFFFIWTFMVFSIPVCIIRLGYSWSTKLVMWGLVLVIGFLPCVRGREYDWATS